MTPTPALAHPGTRPTAAGISFLAGIAFLVLLTLIHAIRPDVSPRWQTTSEYAVGGLGWLMVTAFLLSAVGYGALAVALLAGPRQALTRAGAVILALAAAGTAVGGVFVTDPIDTPQDQLSTSGTLHGLGAGLALMVLPVAALLVNLGLARSGGPAVPGRLLRWTAALPLAALVMFLTAQAVLLGDDGFGPDVPIGWPERILVLAYAGWQITVARVVARRTARP
ncbi:DUF998 domain-containing protein [Actinoplanes sp. ATCC 53533]|uniref:DUF998 domain-containing protein n=1 Tax=Actinoplanes sp. ATCC 53533 TaxID=1288362 RepID=UPI0013157924|nr:DUF998 domain-containing protein [Actinoplanes sp. ATCC 53533]